MSASDGSWSRQSTTYYDTASQDLRRLTVSLALVEEGAARHQIATRFSDAAVCEPTEALRTDARDGFPVATGDPLIDADIDATRPFLGPGARITVDRWRCVGSYQGAEISVTLDLGRGERWDRDGRHYEGALSNASIVLVEGSERAFFEFAALFADAARLVLEPHTPLQRAQQLARPAQEIEKAPRARAIAEEPVGALLQRTLALIVTRLAEMRAAIVETRQPEGVHQMRVALRRFRSIERLFRKPLKGVMASHNAQAKAIADALGPARDWDVFCRETLTVLSGEQANETGAAELRARAEALRAAHWNTAVAAVTAPSFTKFLIGLTELSLCPPWEKAPAMQERTRDVAERALDRVLKKTFAVAQDLDAENLAARHPLRIALKKLRYPVQMFRDLYPSADRKPYMAALSTLQDSFGALNDGVTAERLADDVSLDASPAVEKMAGFVAGFKTAQARRAAMDIDSAWSQFEEMKPFWRKD